MCIVQPCGSVYDSGICQLYSMGPSITIQILFTIHTFKLNLEIMYKNHYSSRSYSQDTLFIPILFLEITIHSNTIIENTKLFPKFSLFILALFILCLGMGFFLFLCFFP